MGSAGPGAQGPQGPAGPADWNAIPNKPAGFADGVDEGITKVTIARVWSAGVSVPANNAMSANPNAYCPDGSKVVGGGFSSSSHVDVLLSAAGNSGSWTVVAKNFTTSTDEVVSAFATCMGLEPSSAIVAAKKGLLPASVKKAIKKRDR